MTTTIRQKFQYAHPVQAVWDYLTVPELIAQWLMPSDFKLEIGHEFQFRTTPKPTLNLDGIMHCKVLEIVPLKKLSYAWRAGSGDGKFPLDTVVVWTLIEKDNGTELHLEHSGFKEGENFSIYTALNDGWEKNMAKIAQRLTNTQNDATHA